MIWKPIPSCPGYDVSDAGTVRNAATLAILRPWISPKGYRLVSPSGQRHRRVHHLVLEAFVGPRPPGAMTRHLDGDPANNTPANLAWGTMKQNKDDMIRHGRSNRGDRHGMAKVSATLVVLIRRLVKAGTLSQAEVARKTGLSSTQVSRICSGQKWAHMPDTLP